MKKHAPVLALVGALLVALIATAAVNWPGTTPDAAGGPDTLDAALPEETPEESGVPEEEPPAPALTLDDVRAISFLDMPAGDERADYVSYAAYRGLLFGVGDGNFDPESFVTRATLITVLFRMSGQEAAPYDGRFADVAGDTWYTAPVAWATQAGVTTGKTEDLFGPHDRLDRAQLAVFLYRFAAFQDGRTYSGDLSDYRDGAAVPDYARIALDWALQNRIFAGMVSDTIHPYLPVSRAQLAQALVALTAYSSDEPVASQLTEQLRVQAADSASVANHEDIQALVDSVASKYGAIGLQVAVIEGGAVTDTYTYGWATKGSAAMTPEHKIRVASITKVAVGMAAMILREDGIVDLDESIGTYWGVRARNSRYPDDPISIRSLLSHTSSIISYGDDTSRTRSAVQARLQSGGYSGARPGSIYSWNYNNYAFGVLGMTLELASDRYLDDILEQRLWSLMDIDAAFEGGCIDATDLLTTLYYHGGSVSRSVASQAKLGKASSPGGSGTFFAGGLTISAQDLAKMFALLASDGRYEGLQLMRPESIELMETCYDYQLPDGFYQALPLRYQNNIYGRDRLYYHTGSAYGVYNCASYDPDTGDGVVVLSVGASATKDSYGIYAVCGGISQYIYDILESPAA